MVKKTFNQIVAKIKQNKYATSSLLLPYPVRGTRNELIVGCSKPRISDFERPGHAIASSIATTSDSVITINATSDCINNCLENNAKRRVRSTGNPIKQTNNFLLTTQSYLNKSGKSVEINSYYGYRTGDGVATESAGILHQQLYRQGNIIRNDRNINIGATTVAFQYQWVNGDYYDVKLQLGKYDLEAVNIAFRNTMFQNKHYLIDTMHNDKQLYFMRFVYDAVNNVNQIQCKGLNTQIYFAAQYKTWTSYDTAVDWILPQFTLIPCVYFTNAEFAEAMGFSLGSSYPPQIINGYNGTQPSDITNQADNYFANSAFYFANGSVNPVIKSKYVPLIYRPLNNYFAQNGAVSSSSLVSKKVYNTVTRNATNDLSVNYRRFDDAAIAYNVQTPGFSLKYILGFDDNCYLKCMI
jgi:hypothetical protein